MNDGYNVRNMFERSEVKWNTRNIMGVPGKHYTQSTKHNDPEGRPWDQFTTVSTLWSLEAEDGSDFNVEIEDSNAIFYGIGSGSGRNGRIGNVIWPQKVDIMLRLLANAHVVYSNSVALVSTGGGFPVEQYLYTSGEGRHGGESMLQSDYKCCTSYYVRTTYRIVVLKDTMALENDEGKQNIQWNDVFEGPEMKNVQSDTDGRPAHTWGVSSYIQEKYISRFKVLYDEMHTVGGQEPQKVVKICIQGKDIGPIRYVGPEGHARKNTDLHIVWAATTMGFLQRPGSVVDPSDHDNGTPDVKVGNVMATWRTYWCG